MRPTTVVVVTGAVLLLLGVVAVGGAITTTANVADEFAFDNVVSKGVLTQQISGATGAGGVLSEADRLTHEYRMTQQLYKLYECIFLAFAVVACLSLVLWSIRKDQKKSGSDIVHASGLIFIIFGTIFLVILADAEAQLTASMGIMGAIAGYLFGKIQNGSAKESTGGGAG